MEEGRLKVIF